MKGWETKAMPRLLEEWRMKGLESSMAAMAMGEKKELLYDVSRDIDNPFYKKNFRP